MAIPRLITGALPLPSTRARIAALLGPNDIVLTGGNALKFDAGGQYV